MSRRDRPSSWQVRQPLAQTSKRPPGWSARRRSPPPLERSRVVTSPRVSTRPRPA